MADGGGNGSMVVPAAPAAAAVTTTSTTSQVGTSLSLSTNPDCTSNPSSPFHGVDISLPHTPCTVLHQKQRRFLIAFAATGRINDSARMAGISKTNHYRWMKESALYRARFADAQEESLERFEATAVRLATEYRRKKKFTAQGVPIIDPETGEQYYEEIPPNWDSLKFQLLNKLPHMYREKKEVSHIAGGGIQITISPAALQQNLEREREKQQLIAAGLPVNRVFDVESEPVEAVGGPGTMPALEHENHSGNGEGGHDDGQAS
jgi:hypothetical protein